MFTWNPRRNLPEMKFQPTIKEIVFTLLFIPGELKGNFVSEVVWGKQSIPYKSQSFLFWWNKCMRTCFLCTCFLPCDFILVSVYMIFFHPKWNFIFVKSTAMKWHSQRISFGLYHVNSYRIFSNRSHGFYLFFVFFSAVSIWGWLLFEGGFYLPQFSVGNSSDGTV